MKTLTIQDLHVMLASDQTPILRGVTLTIAPSEIHAIMGPNGSGKSTLSKVLMGHPAYEVAGGDILLDGENILDMEPEERAHAGLFLGFQSPPEIAGVHYREFLHVIHQQRVLEREGLDLKQARKDPAIRREISPVFFKKELLSRSQELKLQPSLLERSVNESFSGGEKKKSEILQMDILEPHIALLDELDSGLDIDALRLLCSEITRRQQEQEFGVLLVTHYPRILHELPPTAVHLFREGRIERTGGMELALQIEKEGYAEEQIENPLP